MFNSFNARNLYCVLSAKLKFGYYCLRKTTVSAADKIMYLNLIFVAVQIALGRRLLSHMWDSSSGLVFQIGLLQRTASYLAETFFGKVTSILALTISLSFRNNMNTGHRRLLDVNSVLKFKTSYLEYAT